MNTNAERHPRSLEDRHRAIGWWALFTFVVLGLALEAFHGFKIGFYLDLSNSSRRLMWTLAHAHGTLLALVHLAFASQLPHVPRSRSPVLQPASKSLIAATWLMPGGFFLGGFGGHGGDPGPGIILAAVGGLLLAVSILLIARQTSLPRSQDAVDTTKDRS